MPSLKLKFKCFLIEKLPKTHLSSSTTHTQVSFFEKYTTANTTTSTSSKIQFDNKHSNTSTNTKFPSSQHISKPRFTPHSKYSMRTNPKQFTGEIETFPGYDALFATIPTDEKEQLLSHLKTLDQQTVSYIFSVLSSKSLYTKLKTKNGFDIIKTYYNDLLSKNKPENKVIINSSSTSIALNEINDECELYICLKDVFNINDIDSCEIFNLFKYNEFYSFNITHFVMLVYLFLAFECNELEDYISFFGESLFKDISSSETYITVARMKTLGNVVGVAEKDMNDVISSLNYVMNSEIDYNKFKEFYTKLGKKLKHDSSSSSSTQQINNQNIFNNINSNNTSNNAHAF
jgi:hypothetical protein